MGIPSASAVTPKPPAGDLANAVMTGSFVGTGLSPAIQLYGAFNLVFYGGVAPNTPWNGTVRVERSFDGGTTWIVASVNYGFAQAIYSLGLDVSVTASELEKGVLYRLNCTAYTSGTIFYRISTNGLAAMTWGIQHS